MDITTSSNPLLKRAFSESTVQTGGMTFEGTATKTLWLVVVMLSGAAVVVLLGVANPVMALAAVVGGFGLMIGTAVNPQVAGTTALPWSFLQGILLGTVSAGLERATNGIVGLACALTAAALLTMLVAYRSRLIRPSAHFRAGVVGATGAIALVYVANLTLEIAGFRSILGGLDDTSAVGVGATVIVLVVAVLNLVLDFDFIERAVLRGAPNSMEWFAAFSLTVTLIWIYVEFLELLGGDD